MNENIEPKDINDDVFEETFTIFTSNKLIEIDMVTSALKKAGIPNYISGESAAMFPAGPLNEQSVIIPKEVEEKAKDVLSALNIDSKSS